MVDNNFLHIVVHVQELQCILTLSNRAILHYSLTEFYLPYTVKFPIVLYNTRNLLIELCFSMRSSLGL